MTCCPFCKRVLFTVVAVGALACAEHGLIFSNMQDGPEPEGVAQATVVRPVPSITTTGGTVPRFVSNQFFYEEPNASQVWANVQAARNSSFMLVVNGAHRTVMNQVTASAMT